MRTNTITIEAPDTGAAAQENSIILQRANALAIADKAQHEGALLFLKEVAVLERRVKDLFGASKKLASDAHKAICAAEAQLLRPLSDARLLVNRKVSDYEAEERRKADEEARRLQERARQQQEDQQLADAVAASESGDEATADAILAEPVAAPVVTVAPAIAKVEGVVSRTTWSAEVTDKMALIRYVAAHPEWAALLDANEPALNGLARSQREALAIPGVKAVGTTTKAVRAS